METQSANVEETKSMRPFFIIWFGQIFSLVGSQVVQFALPWWLTLRAAETTDNPATVLALATLVAMLPQALLSPVAGALVDRLSRRKVMIYADGATALASLGLALLYWTGAAEIWHVFVVMFIRGVGGSFHWPAMQASISLMVPEKHFSRVAGLNSALSGALNVVGPGLGALLLEQLHEMQWVMMVDVGTALIAILPLLFVTIPQPVRTDTNGDDGGAKSSVWADLRAGLRYTREMPGLLSIMVMAMIINFLSVPAFSMMPLLVKTHFLGGAPQYAASEAAWGAGVLVGGLLLGVWGGFRRKVFTSLSGLMLMGIGVTAIAFVPSDKFALVVVFTLLAGAMNPIVNGPLHALLQSVVTPEMQGRVFTLTLSLSILITPLSLAVAGPVADLIGVRALYLVGGLSFLIAGGVAMFVPSIANVEENNARPANSDAHAPALATAGAVLEAD
jgi:DHA3 family macrolide efflux protein-like MFS transporter